jgi:HSP20 family protein
MKKLSMRSAVNALRELDALQHRLQALFSGSGGTEEWNPVLELFEGESSYLINVDLPGVEKGDVEVCVEDGHLLISCSRKHENLDLDDSRYVRSFQLPVDVIGTKISAVFGDGILVVRLPKGGAAPPVVEGRRYTVVVS